MPRRRISWIDAVQPLCEREFSRWCTIIIDANALRMYENVRTLSGPQSRIALDQFGDPLVRGLLFREVLLRRVRLGGRRRD